MDSTVKYNKHMDLLAQHSTRHMFVKTLYLSEKYACIQILNRVLHRKIDARKPLRINKLYNCLILTVHVKPVIQA